MRAELEIRERWHVYAWEPEIIWGRYFGGYCGKKIKSTNTWVIHEKKLIPELEISGKDKAGSAETEEKAIFNLGCTLGHLWILLKTVMLAFIQKTMKS